MARGGKRQGAGRPRGDRQATAYGYRPLARDIVRADLRGIDLGALIDEALDVTNVLEDHDPETPPLVLIHRILSRR